MEISKMGMSSLEAGMKGRSGMERRKQGISSVDGMKKEKGEVDRMEENSRTEVERMEKDGNRMRRDGMVLKKEEIEGKRRTLAIEVEIGKTEDRDRKTGGDLREGKMSLTTSGGERMVHINVMMVSGIDDMILDQEVIDTGKVIMTQKKAGRIKRVMETGEEM